RLGPAAALLEQAGLARRVQDPVADLRLGPRRAAREQRPPREEPEELLIEIVDELTRLVELRRAGAEVRDGERRALVRGARVEPGEVVIDGRERLEQAAARLPGIGVLAVQHL